MRGLLAAFIENVLQHYRHIESLLQHCRQNLVVVVQLATVYSNKLRDRRAGSPTAGEPTRNDHFTNRRADASVS